jgi:hypothetical protein
MRKQKQHGKREKNIQRKCEKLWNGLVRRTSQKASPRRPCWDYYRQRQMYIPHFVFGGDIPDGELIGICRGDGVISGEEEAYEDHIGIYTDEGLYYNILVDTRFECALMQFAIEEEPFFFPIVRYLTIEGRVPCIDPKTGIYYKRQPNGAPSTC